MIIKTQEIEYEISNLYAVREENLWMIVTKVNDDNFCETMFIDYLSSIYSDLYNAGECDGFRDCMDSHGEHTTEDFIVDPEKVWAGMDELEKIEFLKESIVKILTVFTLKPTPPPIKLVREGVNPNIRK